MGKIITLENGTKIEISEESYKALAKAIDDEKYTIDINKIACIKSGNRYTYKIYKNNMQIYVNEDGIFTSETKFINNSHLKCKWIETSREYLKVGDVVCFVSTREALQNYEPRLIVSVTGNFLDLQHINWNNVIGSDSFSRNADTCFIARLI